MADSGVKQVVVNTRERAVSDDLNRLQAFGNRGLAEILRYLLDVSYGTDDLDAGAISTEITSVPSGVPNVEILGGLLVRPSLGSLLLTIDPGMCAIIDPGANPSPDDSPYKLVKDPGVLSTVGMSMTGNATIAASTSASDIAAATRVDVIECQRFTQTVESDNRDVFNANSGLFTATTVVKATESRLTYRVRQGTVGAGFPETAAGWLPLAVASVPPQTTSNDQITFWDVRPLINDRWPSLQNVSLSRVRRLNGAFNSTNPAAATGLFDLVYKGRRLGGRLRRGSIGTDGDTFNFTDPANIDPTSSTLTNFKLCSLVFALPYGLPRWARYTDVTAGQRVPRSPRGIPIFTSVPIGEDGVVMAPVTLPANVGLGVTTTSDAVMAIESYSYGQQMTRIVGTEAEYMTVDNQTYTTFTAAGYPYIGGQQITLKAGIDFPTGAKRLRITIFPNFTPTGSGPTYANFILLVAPDGSNFSVQTSFSTTGIGGQLLKYPFEMEFPLPPQYPTVAPGHVYTLVFVQSGAAGSFTTSPTLLINSWRY